MYLQLAAGLQIIVEARPDILTDEIFDFIVAISSCPKKSSSRIMIVVTVENRQ